MEQPSQMTLTRRWEKAGGGYESVTAGVYRGTRVRTPATVIFDMMTVFLRTLEIDCSFGEDWRPMLRVTIFSPRTNSKPCFSVVAYVIGPGFTDVP